MIAIIDYKAGNIHSVQNAISRLGYQSVVTDDISVIHTADKVILPGVGEAQSAMDNLRAKGLDKTIIGLRKPFLGICLGLQLLCQFSEEGDTDCLGIFDSKVRLFPSTEIVPHMGWNNFESIEGVLFDNVKPQDNVYYVHSYYAETCSDTVAVCNYIESFSAALQKGNFYATQFHPEKSSSIGEQILKNFLEL